MKTVIQKIVSGGQTGADRAALDFAIEHGLPHGGWCPQGRMAEDGEIDWRYRLKETPSPSYVERTEWNVRDSDGTIILSIAKNLGGGSQLTVQFAMNHKKPYLHLSKSMDGDSAAVKLRQFLEQNQIKILNVAGPRSSTEPAVEEFVKSVLAAALFL